MYVCIVCSVIVGRSIRRVAVAVVSPLSVHSLYDAGMHTYSVSAADEHVLVATFAARLCVVFTSVGKNDQLLTVSIIAQ